MAHSVFAVCSNLWTPVAVPFSYSHSIPRQVVESAAVCFIGTHGFSVALSVPQGCRVGDMQYSIPEIAPSDWAICPHVSTTNSDRHIKTNFELLK